jgi:hypothetical protein
MDAAIVVAEPVLLPLLAEAEITAAVLERPTELVFTDEPIAPVFIGATVTDVGLLETKEGDEVSKEEAIAAFETDVAGEVGSRLDEGNDKPSADDF